MKLAGREWLGKIGMAGGKRRKSEICEGIGILDPKGDRIKDIMGLEYSIWRETFWY